MYLTKVELNLKKNAVVSVLSNVNYLHKFVMSGFNHIETDTARKDLEVLYELQEGKKTISILVQSKVKPIYDELKREDKIKSYQTKDISFVENGIKNGMNLRLEVLAEPYKKVENKTSRHSRRRVLTNEEDKKDWFKRKITDHGCEVLADGIRNTDKVIYGRKSGNKILYRPSLYSCFVTVADADAFVKMIKEGIGSGKSYGMGMVKLVK